MKTNVITSLRLHVDDPATGSAIAEAAAELVRARSNGPGPRLSVTLDGELLPAPLVGALVSALRRLREVGGALEVVPATVALRDQLEIHGLARVFAFPIPPEEAPRRPRGRGVGAALRIGAALGFVALACTVPAANAQDLYPTNPPAILERVIARNPNLESYQGRLHVQVRLATFPYIRERLEGTTYFKRPANYEVVFDRVPFYARGFDKLYSDAGDPANWQRRFTITYEGQQRVAGHTELVLRLVQRVRGMIDHETAFIDPSIWAIEQIRYDYYNGGSVTMTQEFRNVGGYQLLAAQTAEIAIPHVRAVASATYDGYRTNVAVDESVFRKGDGQ